ncbi:uncharacterized protein TRIADDRAFT_60591 [Trichoplax adhaerens]|uniref:Mitochondrial outer membrane transport complex Sam37/metaxin N-terminal domain-containing protein n=1 Tax=Trichoplax adhaerens TaxID=10228 RepID=B3S8M4_TRIAD|nr:hypothetical protein TRIADDRAFT_60591 [Trichoplax adhaerens]EDV20911.1 hypothetical protein TRIADDRAFT_60591 [Trichoplax adhaerens]|eukprot:XP_002116555.1 hypothetical protein TRIADDRAFT_60591 [Trichoplax adhaerens]
MATAPPSDEAWTKSIELYCKPSDEELLYEKGEKLAVKAYLAISRLEYSVHVRSNTEFMSPSGVVPIIRVPPLFFCGFNAIANFIELKERSASSLLDSQTTADMKAYISLIQDKLLPAELTKHKYGDNLPSPLNQIIPWLKRQSIIRSLRNRELPIVYSDAKSTIKQVLQALSNRLGTSLRFFDDRLTELDALAYGHLKSIQDCDLLEIRNLLTDYPNLVVFCNNFPVMNNL